MSIGSTVSSVEDDGSIRSFRKEGVNFGVSGMLRHYPGPDLTLAILGIDENAVWQPVELLDRAAWSSAAS